MSQNPILPPEDQPELPWEDRLDQTRKHLANLKPLPTPPLGFDALKATKEEIIKAGLPSPPNPETQPALYAKWKSVLSRSYTHVPSRFAAITIPRNALPQGLKKLAGGTGASLTSGNWSGAVNLTLASGDSFSTVTGSWTVPNAYPPESAKLPSGLWQDGMYLCVSWVGIDGWNTGDVLQAGTGSQCIVSGGKIISQSAFAWHEWYTDSWINFADFPVSPGDSIGCTVCAPNGAGSTTGSAWIHNSSTGQYTSVAITAPPNIKLAGNCAEWVLEDPKWNGVPAPFPDYGAEFFYDCGAGTVKGAQVDLSTANLINLVINGTTVSTAVEESPKVLMTYTGSSGP
jgi:hypothetical protein